MTPEEKSIKSKIFYGYFIVLITFCVIAINDGALHSFGVFLTPLLTEFGWTTAATSGAYSLFMTVGGLLAVVMGRLNDRFGPRLVITAGGFFLGLGYLLASFTSNLWQFYLFYGVIAATGMSAVFVPSLSTVARWFSKRRGMMTGIALASIGFGTMVGPPLISRIIVTYGWRTSFVAVGLTALVGIMVAAQFLKKNPAVIGAVPYGAGEVTLPEQDILVTGVSLHEAVRTPPFWMLAAMIFCLNYSVATTMVHIVPHATDLGIPAVTAANIMIVIGGVSIVGRVLVGAASDRIGLKQSYVVGFILLAGGYFWLTQVGGMWMIYLFGVVFGFSYGGLVSLMSPMVAKLFGLKSHSAILAGAMLGGTAGSAIGPLIAGEIFDVTSSYQAVFFICAALAVIGVALSAFIRVSGDLKQQS